jgi:hypothetical protein
MGLLASAVGGAGEGIATAGKKYGDYLERSTLQQEFADITKARDERMQTFQTSERIGGQEFQTLQQQRGFSHAETLQQQGFTHAENLQINQQDYQSVENYLTREQQSAESVLNRASSEKIAKLGRDTQMSIAKMHGTVQVGNDGKILWVGPGGEVKDTGFTAAKDLPATAKAASEILRDQLKAIDKAEADGTGNPSALAAQRTRVNGQLLAVLSGDINKAFAQPAAEPSPGDLDILKRNSKNPQAVQLFEQKFGSGSAARHLQAAGTSSSGASTAPGAGLLNSQTPAAPSADMTAQQRREAEMRAQYDREQEAKRAAGNAHQKEFQDNIERTRLRSEM